MTNSNTSASDNASFFASVDRNCTITSNKSLDLNDQQQQAFDLAHEWYASKPDQPFVLTGFAGTGKSYTAQRIAQSLQARYGIYFRIALTAPTHKARAVLEGFAKQAGLKNVHIATLHSLLHVMPGQSDANGRIKLEPNNFSQEPRYRDFDLVIVDECFAFHQPVLTEEGMKYIGEIVRDRHQGKVYSYNPQTQELELKPIVRWLTKDKPSTMLKINATRSSSKRSGRFLTVTHSHKILTPSGYKQAGGLRVGDLIVGKDKGFTDIQRSIVIGSLLGDGSIHTSKNRTSPQITMMQSSKRLDYLEFKRKAFLGICSEMKEGKSGYSDGVVYSFTLDVNDETYWLAREFADRNPSDAFFDLIDPQALAVWFMDDGSVQNRTLATGKNTYYARINSQGLSEKRNHKVAEILRRKFDLCSTVYSDNKGYFYLSFSKAETFKLFATIQPFIPECMSYKCPGRECVYTLPMGRQPETAFVKIRSICEVESTTVRGNHVYDLEVADHHNYIAGNVVVSNCSMIGKELLEFIPKSIPTIMMGDQAQLPPVDVNTTEPKDSPIFDLPLGTNLTQVMRYEGSIAEYATAIRQDITAQFAPRISSKGNLTKIKDKGAWERSAIAAFRKTDFVIEPDSVRVLAWTNKRVAELNQMIRNEFFDPSVQFCAGERLMAKQPIIRICGYDDKEILMQTCAEATVKKVKPTNLLLNLGGNRANLDAWYLQVETDLDVGIELAVVARKSWDVARRMIFDFKKSILETENTDERKGMWRKYYETLERLNLTVKGNALLQRLQYAFVLTIHQSQGSTFKHVFVDQANVWGCRVPKTRNQLLYVSTTRASESLTVYSKY